MVVFCCCGESQKGVKTRQKKRKIMRFYNYHTLNMHTFRVKTLNQQPTHACAWNQTAVSGGIGSDLCRYVNVLSANYETTIEFVFFLKMRKIQKSILCDQQPNWILIRPCSDHRAHVARGPFQLYVAFFESIKGVFAKIFERIKKDSIDSKWPTDNRLTNSKRLIAELNYCPQSHWCQVTSLYH